jgi:DNA repair exonuclease SbcCD ATPase subunit
MSSGDKNKQSDEQEETEGQATERGFGTGLRAQLQKRRGDQPEAQATPAQQSPDPPLVRVDLYTSAPHQVNAGEPSPELEEVRGQLAEAQKRELELRAAFAEQVEAYERKLSEEYDVSREQTKLHDRSAKLSSTENEIRQREQRLAEERRELNAERQRLSLLHDEVAAAQSAAAELQEELQARDAELKPPEPHESSSD